MLMKMFHLMQYCVLAVGSLETNEPECWLPNEYLVLFNVVFLKWVATTVSHVQLVHNALIRIRTLNLSQYKGLSHWATDNPELHEASFTLWKAHISQENQVLS